MLNSDAEPSENWLEPLIQCAQNHPNFGAAQPLIIDYFQRDKFEYAGAAGGFMDVFGFPFCRGRIFGNVELNQSQYTETLPVFWASGAALFIKRSCWEEAQGLDEAFFAHMEEIDLCWRLKTMNYEIYACPQSSVFHMGGATLSNQNPRKTYLNFRNGLLMLHKNLPDSIREKRILERKKKDKSPKSPAALFIILALPAVLQYTSTLLRQGERSSFGDRTGRPELAYFIMLALQPPSMGQL